MRRRIEVASELKRLEGSFLTREMRLERMVKRGDSYVLRRAPVKVVDFEGVEVEYLFLLKLLKVFKQTRVKSVTVEAVPNGVHILFDRAFYFLKGIEDG